MIASDLARLHRGILECPHDDTLRLVYADALEEDGQADRAELIRVQIYKATRHCSAFMYSCYEHGTECRCDLAANQRERELLPTFQVIGGMHCSDISYRRGMVDHVSLPLEAFMEHAGALFQNHPITSVTVTDRKPARMDGVQTCPTRFSWLIWNDDNIAYFQGSSYNIPSPLTPYLLKTGEPLRADVTDWRLYPDEGSAMKVLDVAAVAYGRDCANLPPLDASRILTSDAVP